MMVSKAFTQIFSTGKMGTLSKYFSSEQRVYCGEELPRNV